MWKWRDTRHRLHAEILTTGVGASRNWLDASPLAELGRERCDPMKLPSKERTMASKKQSAAARRNIKKAAAAAKRKKTISKLPKKTRTALGKQGAKVAKQNRKRS